MCNVRFGKQSQLKTIGKDAFRESGLKEFTAPAGLTQVGTGAFFGCASIKKAVFCPSLRALGSDNGANQQGVFEKSTVAEV